MTAVLGGISQGDGPGGCSVLRMGQSIYTKRNTPPPALPPEKTTEASVQLISRSLLLHGLQTTVNWNRGSLTRPVGWKACLQTPPTIRSLLLRVVWEDATLSTGFPLGTMCL